MRYTKLYYGLLCIIFTTSCNSSKSDSNSTKGVGEESNRPNIIYILCDDLGYGDVHALDSDHALIPTPHADCLAREGMIFTDAHSGSSVCTPTRYGVLTGRYSWRTRLQGHVVQGHDPNLIAEDRTTVASHLKSLGYHTAILGKWHLDFQYLDAENNQIIERPRKKQGFVPIGTFIPDGPISRGFDYFSGFHHAGSMQMVIENNKVIAEEDEVHMLPNLTTRSVAYIKDRAKQKNEPFFLYLPLGSPHKPHVPSPEWVGKSGLGVYADFVMQTDHVLGEVRKALEETGLDQNTLIIFTSDNGCSQKSGSVEYLAEQGHRMSAHMRGSKADLWDGGHRVPFIAHWPGVVDEGSTSDQLICLTDLFATVTDITGTSLPENQAEDSFSFLAALQGEKIQNKRKGVIHHSISGHFGYRQDNWKLLLAKGSGGWSSPTEDQVHSDAPKAQLYNLEKDPSEQVNLYEKMPEKTEELLQNLTEDIERGSTREGVTSKNDYPELIKLWKSGD